MPHTLRTPELEKAGQSSGNGKLAKAPGLPFAAVAGIAALLGACICGNQMLSETTNNKEISLTQLITLNKKISVREEIISTINREVELLQSQISKGNDSIDVMQTRLDDLKKEYARMIYDAYKNENAYSKLMLFFHPKILNRL